MSKLSFKTFCIEYYAEHTKQSSEKYMRYLRTLSYWIYLIVTMAIFMEWEWNI